MAWASETLKEDAQRSSADRPYTTAAETMNSTAGKARMGRSQDVTNAAPSVQSPDAKDRNAPPAAPAPGAAAAPVASGSEAPAPPPPPGETPAWPSDIASRYAPEVTRGLERGGMTDMPLGQRDLAPDPGRLQSPDAKDRNAPAVQQKDSPPAGSELGTTAKDASASLIGAGRTGLDARLHSGFAGAVASFLTETYGVSGKDISPQEYAHTREVGQQLADMWFQGHIGTQELDLGLKAAAKFIEPRLPGAVAALREFATADGGMARVDMGLTPPSPEERLAALTDQHLDILRQMAHDPQTLAQVDGEIARRSSAAALADTLRADGKTEAADSFDAIVGDAGKVTPKTSGVKPFSVAKPLALDASVAPTKVPAAAAIRYPAEENLGIPAGYKNLPENIQAAVVKNARSIYDEVQQARGGVVPLSQVHQESKQIMIDAGILAQTAARTPVTAPGAEALIAAHVQVSAEREALMAQAAEVWPHVPEELQARIAVKAFEQNSIQKVIAGARAEWGRVGQQWQRALASGDPAKMRDVYASVKKALGGNANLDDVVQRLHDIENDPLLFGDPYRAQKVARKQVAFIDQIHPATTAEKLREAFRNGILSIPVTHEAYVMGMSMYREVEALSKIPAAVIDKVLAPIERGGLLGAGARVTREAAGTLSFNQALTEVAATQASIPRALKAFGLALWHGDARAGIFEETGKYSAPRALAGSSGAVLNLPTRIINAYTAALHVTGEYPAMMRQAVAIAEKEMPRTSILNRSLLRRAAEIAANPEDALAPKAPGLTAEATARAQQAAIQKALDMRAVAKAEGQRISLRGQQQGGLAERLRGVRDWEPRPMGKSLGGIRPLYRVMPFINIGFNIVEQGLEYSPLGFARVVATAGPQRAEAIARAGMGTMLWKVFADKADAGELTGATPTDPNERAEWQREGKTAYSLKIGGSWYPIDRFEPLATTVKWMAGFNDAVKDMQASPDPNGLAAHAVLAMKMAGVIAQGFNDMTWNVGLSQLGAILTTLPTVQDDPTKTWDAVQNYAGEQLASQTPFSGFLKRGAQAYDPYVRSPHGVAQQIEAMIPGLSALVPKSAPSRYGEDTKRPESQQGLRGMFDPSRGTPAVVDPVDAELMKHQLPAPNGGTVKTLFMTLAAADIAGFKLDPEEGRLMQTYVGRAAHQGLARLFDGKSLYNGQPYAKLPEDQKVKAIQKAIIDARRTGRAATADVIVQGASDAPTLARGMEMRLSLITDQAERALYVEGIQKQGRLSPQASALLTTALRAKKKDSPTAAEYLAAAPGVREYLAIPAFVGGDPAVLKEMETERSAYDEQRRIDALDGTGNATAYFQTAQALQQYARIGRGGALAWTVRENPARARYRAQHKDLAPFLGGLTYTQQETP